MTGGRIILPPTNPSLDSNGNPVSGAQLTFYQNGTTTPVSIYSDRALTVPLANPLTSDSAGVFPQVWASNGVGYSVKWSRTGFGDVTFNDIYPDLDSAAVGSFISTNQAQVQLGSNIGAAFGTVGVGLVENAFTQTDSTTAVGTVPTAYSSVFGATTFATPTNAITITTCYGTYFKDPVAGAHVTLTNKYAIGADSLNVIGALVIGAKIASLGTTGTQLNLTTGATEGNVVLAIAGTHTLNPMSLCDVAGTGANNAGTGFQIQKHSSTSRSINAAGTVNASGADYAEYEKKAADCGEIAKGQIVGFDANGFVTDKFANSISFGIKTTSPSYVGGDSWGSDEALGITRPIAPIDPGPDATDQANAAFQASLSEYTTAKAAYDAALEAARQKVDRIAYSGKVPVNVTGANVGDFILASQSGDGISGTPVASPTFDQYRVAVGRVRSLLTDGRCVVAVIVH